MAEYTSTAYSKIIIYAIIPALLYYLGVFLAVHFRALKLNLKPSELELSLSKREMLWQGLTCLAGFLTLVVLLVLGFSATRCALISIVALCAVWIIRPIDRMTFRDFIHAMEVGGRGMISTSTACIGAGIVVGCIGMSGLGIKLSVVVGLAKANVWLVLLLVMVVCIILGMGLPVSASYVLASTTMASVMMKYGLELIPVHMFLLFFATMSAITPPVALASYASAGIAEANPNRVGWKAVLLVLPAFMVPFIFVMWPELLMMGEPMDILLAVASAAFGIFAFSIVTEGWIFCRVPIVFRISAAAAVVCLMVVGLTSDLIGYGILAVIVGLNYVEKKRTGGGAAI